MAEKCALRLLVENFQARSPVRAWSLIVSVFGVLALPGRRALRLSDLQDWLGDCGIEAGLVRTSLSRLVGNGTLLRERDGKAALYRLSAAAEAEFTQAADLIYGRDVPVPTGWLELAILEGGHSRIDVRKTLSAQGFQPLASGALIRPEHVARHADIQAGVLHLHVAVSDMLLERAHDIWPLAELARGYGEIRILCQRVIAHGANMSAHDRLLCRVLLVHAYRRLVLRDPFLPSALLPTVWPGPDARALFDSALKVLEDTD